MEQPIDIDLVLTLHPHGWSTCSFLLPDRSQQCLLTHAFDDPYEALIDGLTGLIAGQDYACFYWYQEPGGYRIQLSRSPAQEGTVAVEIAGFTASFPETPGAAEPILKFETDLTQLVTLFYFQLYKTYRLLEDNRFAASRAGYFPFRAFQRFKALVAGRL